MVPIKFQHLFISSSQNFLKKNLNKFSHLFCFAEIDPLAFRSRSESNLSDDSKLSSCLNSLERPGRKLDLFHLASGPPTGRALGPGCPIGRQSFVPRFNGAKFRRPGVIKSKYINWEKSCRASEISSEGTLSGEAPTKGAPGQGEGGGGGWGR